MEPTSDPNTDHIQLTWPPPPGAPEPKKVYRPEPTLSFYKDPHVAWCNICKCQISNQIMASVTTCDGMNGYFEFCKPCILKNFEEAENKDKVPPTTLG